MNKTPKEQYAQTVDNVARFMVYVKDKLPEAVPIHSIAEVGELPDDLWAVISVVAKQHPDRDLVVYFQRVDLDVLEQAVKDMEAK